MNIDFTVFYLLLIPIIPLLFWCLLNCTQSDHGTISGWIRQKKRYASDPEFAQAYYKYKQNASLTDVEACTLVIYASRAGVYIDDNKLSNLTPSLTPLERDY